MGNRYLEAVPDEPSPRYAPGRRQRGRPNECQDPRCRAPIFMLNNDNTGKPGPIDMEPVKGGNITIDPAAGTYHVLNKEDKARPDYDPDAPRHTSHFATCPFATRFH